MRIVLGHEYIIFLFVACLFRFLIQTWWFLSVWVCTLASLIQIRYYFLLFLWDRFWSFTLILHRVFIDIGFFRQKLRFDVSIDEIFELKWTSWFGNVFFCHLILILFLNQLFTIVWRPVILLRDLSFLWVYLIVFVNCLWRLDLCLDLHVISIYWWCTFRIGKIFRLKWWMMDYDWWTRFFFFRLMIIWWYFIGIDWLGSHSLYLLLGHVFLCFFRMGINVDTVDVLLYLLDDIWLSSINFVNGLTFLLEPFTFYHISILVFHLR